MVSPRFDAGFARLAVTFLETGDRALLPRIATTGGARHITAHAHRVSVGGETPQALELVERLLVSPAMDTVDPKRVRARLSWMVTDQQAQVRTWNEAAAYLPDRALDRATLFLTVGYDLGVAICGNASLNLAHPRFALDPEELWFYGVHELHHAGFQQYHELPRLAHIRTTHDLAGLIRYLTTMEGQAVHAARRWRTAAGALESDSDYIALLDPQRMEQYQREFSVLYHGLMDTEPRPLEQDDWEILERMSTGDRLWYRVGAKMANRIEQESGREILVRTIVEGPLAFFDRYAALATGEPHDRTTRE